MIGERQTVELSQNNIRPRSYAPFLFTTGEKKVHFCESVHTDLHKNGTKNRGFRKRYQKWISKKITEVFENALNQCESTKTEVIENAPTFKNELHRTGEL